jgi:hypothetical protein
MMTTDASAATWENRPPWSWFPLTYSTAIYHAKRNEKTSAHHHLPRWRHPATPSGNAPAKEELLLEYLNILQGGDYREDGATGASECSQTKTIIIRLPDS